MKVVLEKHGGFAAMARAPAVVDDAKLTADERAEFERLVAAVRIGAPAQASTNEAARDAMSFKISVDDEGSTTVYRARDTAMSDAFGKLLRWIEAHARNDAGQ